MPSWFQLIISKGSEVKNSLPLTLPRELQENQFLNKKWKGSDKKVLSRVRLSMRSEKNLK